MPNASQVNKNRAFHVARLDLGSHGGMYEACRLTTTALTTGTYSATTKAWTVTATGTDSYDSVQVALGDRILVTGDTTKNGIYKCTTAGAVGVRAVYTRASDMLTSNDFKNGAVVAVTAGTTYTGTQWTFTIPAAFVLDTDTPVVTVGSTAVNAGTVHTALAASTTGVNFNGQALTSLTLAASLVTVADADSVITGTTVETALTEIAKKAIAGLGIPVSIPVVLATATSGAVVGRALPGVAGVVRACDLLVTTAPTTSLKTATFQVQISGTSVTGGAIAVTSTGLATLATRQSSTTITAANSFTATQEIQVKMTAAAAAFAEGNVVLHLYLDPAA